jgi:ABC-type polar amino acid transport system ATPase subunit
VNETLPVVLDGVCKRYGPRVVLDDVNLSIGAGETVAIIGPSGGGKSTLLRCINGLNPFDQGKIHVGPHVLRPGDDRRPAGDVQRVRRSLGMIFQDFQLFPHFTVLQNVIEAPLRVLKLPKEQARQRGLELLGRVGLADRADSYPGEMSGGQKQRVAIARAMAMQPRGLLCDEITSALDPELKCEVLSVLEDLNQDGLTLILVTHEIGFARRAADRVVVLAEGRVLEDGPPEQILDDPQTPRTKKFLSQVLA